jgi:hypothetical protein
MGRVEVGEAVDVVPPVRVAVGDPWRGVGDPEGVDEGVARTVSVGVDVVVDVAVAVGVDVSVGDGVTLGVDVAVGVCVAVGVGVPGIAPAQYPPCSAKSPPRSVPASGWPTVPRTRNEPLELVPPPPSTVHHRRLNPPPCAEAALMEPATRTAASSPIPTTSRPLRRGTGWVGISVIPAGR